MRYENSNSQISLRSVIKLFAVFAGATLCHAALDVSILDAQLHTECERKPIEVRSTPPGSHEMDHSAMDHSGHMGMGANQCSMNMLFTWSTNNLCIVFRQWHVTGPLSLVLSLVAIAALTAGYECIRDISRRYEQDHRARFNALNTGTSHGPGESSSLLWAGKENQAQVERKAVMIRAALYALQVFYSFLIMLFFMTYNGFVMLAVAVGAFVGYLVFGADLSSTKSVACH